MIGLDEMKASELRDLTGEELVQRRNDARQELFNLRLQQVRNQLQKNSRIRELRRDIARVMTVINERKKRG